MPSILRFVSNLFFNISKENKQKIVLGFVNILVLIFEKGSKQKNCARYFKICKYIFLIFGKGNNQKKCAWSFKICKYTF